MAAVLSRDGLPGAAQNLADGVKSLLRQAKADKNRLQPDGWGLAFYPADGKPEIVKSPGAVFDGEERFRAALRKIPGRGLALAHIRQASNPMNLPKAKLLGRFNTQPFSGAGFVFAHNGTINIPLEVKDGLGKYEKYVKGINDSEVLFWRIMKALDACGDPAAAFERAISGINLVWKSARGRARARGKKAPYTSLNAFLSDGKTLWVLCHYPDGAGKESLMTPGWEYGAIAWRADAEKAVFASEPLDGGRWRKMPNRSIARASLTPGGVDLKFLNTAL